MAIQVIYYNLQENKKNRTGKNAYISTFACIVKKKAKRKSPTHGGVNQEEDSPLFFLMFLGAMCRACIQLLLIKKARHEAEPVARYGLVPTRCAKSGLSMLLLYHTIQICRMLRLCEHCELLHSRSRCHVADAHRQTRCHVTRHHT